MILSHILASIIFRWALAIAFSPTAASEAPVLDYLEPSVQRYLQVLSPSACRELIERAEQVGFPLSPDSIDYGEDASRYQASQALDVVDNGEVILHDLWNLITPWVPKLTKIVQEQQDEGLYKSFFPDEPDKVPKVDWVFIRKYSPRTKRNSLKLHYDINLHTVNVALSDDYQGGGLFYVKPPVQLQEQDDENSLLSPAPEVMEEYKTYEWLERLQRHNKTDVIFPLLQTGDVLVHNYTVWHAIAPIERGTKYSLVLFFDMDNPAVRDSMTSQEEEDQVGITIYHEITTQSIDLVWVYSDSDGLEEMSVVHENFSPFEPHHELTYPGDVFRAVVTGTSTVVAEFVVDRDRSEYKILPLENDAEEL